MESIFTSVTSVTFDEHTIVVPMVAVFSSKQRLVDPMVVVVVAGVVVVVAGVVVVVSTRGQKAVVSLSVR